MIAEYMGSTGNKEISVKSIRDALVAAGKGLVPLIRTAGVKTEPAGIPIKLRIMLLFIEVTMSHVDSREVLQGLAQRGGKHSVKQYKKGVILDYETCKDIVQTAQEAVKARMDANFFGQKPQTSAKKVVNLLTIGEVKAILIAIESYGLWPAQLERTFGMTKEAAANGEYDPSAEFNSPMQAIMKNFGPWLRSKYKGIKKEDRERSAKALGLFYVAKDKRKNGEFVKKDDAGPIMWTEFRAKPTFNTFIQELWDGTLWSLDKPERDTASEALTKASWIEALPEMIDPDTDRTKNKIKLLFDGYEHASKHEYDQDDDDYTRLMKRNKTKDMFIAALKTEIMKPSHKIAQEDDGPLHPDTVLELRNIQLYKDK